MNLADLHRIRDAIAEGLEVRRGCIITDEIVRDRAANITEYLRPIIEDLITAALRDAARGEVVGPLIDGARPREEMAGDGGPRVGFAVGSTGRHLEDLEAEDVAIGTVRPPAKGNDDA